jgi:hypothetical protein
VKFEMNRFVRFECYVTGLRGETRAASLSGKLTFLHFLLFRRNMRRDARCQHLSAGKFMSLSEKSTLREVSTSRDIIPPDFSGHHTSRLLGPSYHLSVSLLCATPQSVTALFFFGLSLPLFSHLFLSASVSVSLSIPIHFSLSQFLSTSICLCLCLTETDRNTPTINYQNVSTQLPTFSPSLVMRAASVNKKSKNK